MAYREDMIDTPLEALRRWEASGATWVLRSIDTDGARVDLVSCDGGEVMGQLASADAAFVAYVREDPPGPIS